MSMKFNGSGSGQHVELGTFDVSSGINTLSIFAWVIFNSFTIPDQRIISKATSWDTGDHWFMFSGITSSQMRVRLRTNGSVTTHFETSAQLYTSTLYHLGFVYNGSTITFYRNGQAHGSSSKSGTINTDPTVNVWIADNPGINRVELDGILEDVRMYERALSPAEVATIYATKGRDNIVAGLTHRWLLSEGYEGQTASGSGLVKDVAGTANGTPTSSPVFNASKLQYGRTIL